VSAGNNRKAARCSALYLREVHLVGMHLMSVLLPDVHASYRLTSTGRASHGCTPQRYASHGRASLTCMLEVHNAKSDNATGCNQRIFLKDRLDCVPDDRHVRVDISSG
jgi:hypothetical protein